MSKTYTIRKSKHAAKPRMIGLWLNKKTISYRVAFDLNCRYQFNNADQLDLNKLFGIGFLWSHHKDSARFGWRYNEDTNKIEVFTYCYVGGERISEYMTSLSFNRSYDFSITVEDDCYRFAVRKDNGTHGHTVFFNHRKRIAYPLGVYFGGNNPAPHSMNIYMKKL